jgi:uncharacterized protein
MPKLTPLARVISQYPSVLVGFSGGVDSALVAVVAKEVLGGTHSVAAIGVSPSLSRAQHEQAWKIAESFRVNLVEVRTDEFGNPAYVSNQTDRCYHCKRELWSKLSGLGSRLGMGVLVDGTNADDLGDHRPGLVAATDFDVRSPLAEAQYTKNDVRAEAHARGIPIWDAPSSPCLSSRVLYGLSVTPQRLGQVELGETFLRSLGVAGDLRVRHRGEEARIEVGESQFQVIRGQAAAIERSFRELGFKRVTLDLRGYRSGSLRDDDDDGIEPITANG